MATYNNGIFSLKIFIARPLAGIFSGIHFLLVALLTPARGRYVKGEWGFEAKGGGAKPSKILCLNT